MKTIGFPISHKENEKRRTILPADLQGFAHADRLYVESGYGQVLGIPDEAYTAAGCQVCSRAQVLAQDVICDPKVGDGEYLAQLQPGQTIFGWVHATQNRDITDRLLASGLTAYAWEKMYEQGRHVFWHNNELAGEAAVMHAFQCYGKMPYKMKIAVLGKGNTAKGAVKALNMFGAEVVQYDRRTEQLFRQEMGQFDAIVNCILWDVMRTDHIVYAADLPRLKPGALLVDVSCDRAGGIETSIPTTIEDPIYTVDGVYHYVVDHTPALFYRTFSENNSQVIIPYLTQLIEGCCGKVLQDAQVTDNGRIVDEEIYKFQKRERM